MSKRIDLESTTTSHSGIKGLFELTLRRFKVLVHIVAMGPIYLISAFVLSLALVPGVFLFRATSEFTGQSSAWIQNLSIAFAIATGYFLYGMTLIFVVPLINWLLRLKLEPWRGPYYSAETLKWFLHNGLTYLVRFTFLEFATPSPLNLLFYRMMGMQIGKGVMINSSWISDPSLIKLGDKVTIGGSVTLVAHYGQGGLLIIAPLKIGKSCTIGLKATIMGGVQIGDGAKILPHSVVLPKTIVPAGETWGGVPAVKISPAKASEPVQHIA